MRNLTATICLTIAVLLGSVTVSWGDDVTVSWGDDKVAEERQPYQDKMDEILRSVPKRPAAAKTKETGGKTFEECILDDMPDVGNRLAAVTVIRECNKKPKAKAGLKSGSWFGPSSRHECMMKYGKKTTVQTASKMIFVACRKLYKK